MMDAETEQAGIEFLQEFADQDQVQVVLGYVTDKHLDLLSIHLFQPVFHTTLHPMNLILIVSLE